ncbi:phospholipase A1 member A [Hyperolius riggenbachi]|uniref:phospholipase A1 member A n=1 Tax=Hyperolius riggenbachi TaxID=752182 RepID=UPI0035A38DBF
MPRRSMAGHGLVLIIVLLTSAWSALAQMENSADGDCGTFQTSGIFQDHKLQVQLLLYTPHHPTCALLINTNQPHSIRNSSFNASLDTKFIIHGFRVLGTKPSWTEKMVDALLGTGPMNVVVVDWVSGSTAIYNQAVDNVPKLSQELVVLIDHFLELGSTLESLHLIGVSLGAHVAGYIGHHYGGRIGWITGLDPAAYKFTRTHPEDRLDPGDAVFVDAIHTDTDNFGIRIPVGHIDYYINGGRDQPGCPSLGRPYKYLICDHMRSIAVFINAVLGTCSFIGFPCSSYQMFQEGLCVDCETPSLSFCPQIGLGKENPLIVPQGDILLSDYNPETENGTNGITYMTAEAPREIQVFLKTGADEPYCAYHILLEFTLTEENQGSITINIQLHSNNTTSSKTKIVIPKDTPGGRSLIAHGTPLCQLQTVEIKVTGSLSRFWRGGPEFSGTLCMVELSRRRRESMSCLPRTVSFSGSGRQVFNIADDMNFACL